MTALGYVPLLPPGAALFSAVVIHNRMHLGSSHASSIEAVFGKASKSTRLVRIVGAGAGDAAIRLFGPGASARQTLEQHTLFGIYCRVMSEHMANQLAKQLIAGNAANFRKAFRGHRQRRIPRLATENLRSCQKCIEADVDLRGFASWRVLHMLPSLGHCPQHGSPLRQEGPMQAGINEGSLLYLPGERPSREIESKWTSIPMSDGYASYLKLWIEAFEGNLTGISPEPWMLVMDAVIDHFGSIAEANMQISSAIERTWSVPIATVVSCLGIADGSQFVRAELEQRIHASYVASRLVIVGALDELKLSPPRKEQSPWQSPIELSNIKPFGSWLTPQTQADLRNCVMDANFPPALFRTLADDKNAKVIDREIAIDRLMIGKFAATMPDDLLYRLSIGGLADWLGSERLEEVVPQIIIVQRRLAYVTEIDAVNIGQEQVACGPHNAHIVLDMQGELKVVAPVLPGVAVVRQHGIIEEYLEAIEIRTQTIEHDDIGGDQKEIARQRGVRLVKLVEVAPGDQQRKYLRLARTRSHFDHVTWPVLVEHAGGHGTGCVETHQIELVPNATHIMQPDHRFRRFTLSEVVLERSLRAICLLNQVRRLEPPTQ